MIEVSKENFSKNEVMKIIFITQHCRLCYLYMVTKSELLLVEDPKFIYHVKISLSI